MKRAKKIATGGWTVVLAAPGAVVAMIFGTLVHPSVSSSCLAPVKKLTANTFATASFVKLAFTRPSVTEISCLLGP